MVNNIHGQYCSVCISTLTVLSLVILSFTRLTSLYSSVSLANLSFTQLNLVNFSVSSKVFAILGLTWLNLVCFSINSSVIFTRLILGLRSIKCSLHTLRVLKTFLLIYSVILGQISLIAD